MTIARKLEPAALCRHCDPAQFKFETTADLPDFYEVIAQERARTAVTFGLGIQRQGYNLFVMGSAGTGKHTLVKQCLEREPRDPGRQLDWVYVNNFELSHKPLALALPAGRGRMLRQDMKQAVEELRSAIPTLFESDEYRSRAEQIEAEFGGRQESALAQLGLVVECCACRNRAELRKIDARQRPRFQARFNNAA